MNQASGEQGSVVMKFTQTCICLMVIFHHIPDYLGYITIELIHVSHVKPHVRLWLQRVTVVAFNRDSYSLE